MGRGGELREWLAQETLPSDAGHTSVLLSASCAMRVTLSSPIRHVVNIEGLFCLLHPDGRAPNPLTDKSCSFILKFALHSDKQNQSGIPGLVSGVTTLLCPYRCF